MLPDFPKFKEKVMDKLQEYLFQAQAKYTGFLERAPIVKLFEGRKGVLVREDGSVDDSEFEPIQARIEIDIREIGKMTPQDVIKKFDDMAKEMARQASENFFSKLNKIVDEAGTKISAEGRPFSVELYLAMLEKVFIPFDDKLNPILPVPIIHPTHEKNVKEAFEKLENDKEIKAKYDAIIARKREQWLAEESARELVG